MNINWKFSKIPPKIMKKKNLTCINSVKTHLLSLPVLKGQSAQQLFDSLYDELKASDFDLCNICWICC